MSNGSKVSRKSIKDKRVPVPKLNYPGLNIDLHRSMTVGQLAVLLWHTYRCVNDPDAGYLDAHITLNELVTKHLNRNIKMTKGMLERLLWGANISDQLGSWWSPDNKSFEQFIQPLLYPDEVFDRTWNNLLDKKQSKRVRNQQRFIKKVTKPVKTKKGI